MERLRATLKESIHEWKRSADCRLDYDGDSDLPGPLASVPTSPVSVKHLYIDDPDYEDPRDPSFEFVQTAESNRSFHAYWPRTLAYYSRRAVVFCITAWSEDLASVEAARRVGGVRMVRSAYDYFTILHGVVEHDWSDLVLEVCWGTKGELRWPGVVLFEPGGLSFLCSHQGGELVLWLPSGVSEESIRSMFPERVNVIEYELSDST